MSKDIKCFTLFHYDWLNDRFHIDIEQPIGKQIAFELGSSNIEDYLTLDWAIIRYN